MSVSIYAYVEGKIDVSDRMEWVSIDYFNRDMEEKGRFEQIPPCGSSSWLAGVLKNIPWDTEARGIPHDCCEYIKEEYARTKDYTYGHHYITLRELLNYPINRIEEEDRGLLIPIIDNIKDRTENILWWFEDKIERRAEDIRLVFWCSR